MKEKVENDKILYQCEECQLLYAEREWAKKCEEWCKKNHSCNLDIISNAEKSTS